MLLPAIFYTGIFSIEAIGFTLQVVAQKHTPANDAALIMGLESVFAVCLGGCPRGEFTAHPNCWLFPYPGGSVDGPGGFLQDSC